jgi:ribosomal subunit interface protein
MNIKISFHNMPHSDPMEAHAREKLAKISEMLQAQADATPFNIELWLKANKLHPHHAVELHVKTPIFDCNAHNEGTDMYVVIDSTIDKMVKQLIKEKERHLDSRHKPETEKKNFSR